MPWAFQQQPTPSSLRRNGPPYENLLNYEASNSYEHQWNSYPELDMNAFRGFLDSAAMIYPQLQRIDFRNDVLRLEVPVYIVLGEHEARGRAEPAQEWYSILEAPAKDLIIIPHAGHRALFDQPAAFQQIMQQVRNDTVTTVR